MSSANGSQADAPKKPIRDRVLDAALRILGEQGLRALTHARIDQAAGLPRGSSSNYFRTRRALLEGVTQYLAQQEQADFASAAPVVQRDQAIEAFIGMLEAQAGQYRFRTIARYILFVGAGHDEELLAPLMQNRSGFEQWTNAILAALGAKQPVEATTFFMATMDGLLLHRLTIDPDLEFAPHVIRALDSCFQESH
ncbi:TetR/AcrR family transcriptional regulator [Enteractinococcus helveticum]|uniref:HTH tetR-type domain-containing protein n=1 Tax=Enteractinococcus helveticum TaxID=1837282 RepID=A0A1B7LY84_9MICC|nr:TetR family transcriptional regulator [Enteractinococcus helveticum]OAV60254.1 hypothetical protein A6F49_12815 [Enteractinococcus helveticum]